MVDEVVVVVVVVALLCASGAAERKYWTMRVSSERMTIACEVVLDPLRR